MPDLDRAVEALAATSVLLVASDFDGTLAPIVADPDRAEPTPRGLRALSTLARQRHTRVVVISGRGLADLGRRMGMGDDRLVLVGSHGSEFEPDRTGLLSDAQREVRDAVRRTVESAAEGIDGVHAEHKATASALHYRRAERADAARAILRLLAARNGLGAGIRARAGKKVVELSVVHGDKGEALARLRDEVGATGVLFVGDDRTDEDAFRTLRAGDVGIKVGSGATAAEHRLADPDDVADLLARLAELRHRALRDSVLAPIADLAYLGDGATGALITPAGEVCWLCPRRFDHPALFASLLGGPTAGRFVVGPAPREGPDPTPRGSQRYLGDSLVVETRWPTLRVIDALDPAVAEAGCTALVREIVPEAPGARARIEFAPGPDFARAEARIVASDGRLEVHAGRERIRLTCPGIDFAIHRVGGSDVARATVALDAPLRLVLAIGRSAVSARRAARTTGEIAAEWAEGMRDLRIPERWAPQVRRSVLALRGLVYRRSGAIVAAPTTSLPEAIGAERNWDYRYCWLRDAALAADALLRVGSMSEAVAYMGWLRRLAEDDPHEELRPLYGVEGESNLVEAELAHLMGYGISQPVRVGNAAADQLQVDVFGPIVDLAYAMVRFGHPVDDGLWRLVRRMVVGVERSWREPDAGIWEHRHLSREHVHSKVMAWAAVDRALRIARLSGRPAPPEWTVLRAEIRAEVLERGWSESAGAFAVAYGSNDLDAAVLQIVLAGLIEPSDPRAVATVEAIERNLCTGTTVYRYRFDDGFSGREGGFHLCASWLVEALSMIGRPDAAERLFVQIAGAAGACGLLSEQVDPETGAALGNTPQAYSHAGLIWNALTLSGSERSRIRDLSDPG